MALDRSGGSRVRVDGSRVGLWSIDGLLERVRGIELRGTAEALTDVDPPIPGTSRAVIRIHPTRIITWGLA